MEYGSIERELHVAASPATVFEVITSPEHLVEWWPDEAVLEAVPGARGELVFGDRAAGTAHVPQLTVVDVEPPTRFSFRWDHPADEVAREDNSLLVVFELAPDGDGTRVRMTESGFRERGWEVAELEARYNDHVSGWGHFLPRLAEYAPKAAVRS